MTDKTPAAQGWLNSGVGLATFVFLIICAFVSIGVTYGTLDGRVSENTQGIATINSTMTRHDLYSRVVKLEIERTGDVNNVSMQMSQIQGQLTALSNSMDRLSSSVSGLSTSVAGSTANTQILLNQLGLNKAGVPSK